MMGFFDKVKKALGSKKEDESRNSVNDQLIDEPTFTESIENDNGNFNDNEEIQSEDSEEIPANEEITDKPTPTEKIRNFKYLDDLIHSGAKVLVLDSDIVLGSDEKSQYLQGIGLDVDDLVIDGNGHTVDAQGKARIFYCTGKNVIIKNIILKNGFAEVGGAIIIWYGELTITESTLAENTAYAYGGAICNNRSELTITESTLAENTAQNFGGAIYNFTASLTVTKSTLTGNTSNNNGGAITNYFRSEVKINESIFTENTAQNEGGAITNKGELTITESTLHNNGANYGGTIYNNKGNFKIFNCEFSSNKSPNNIILNNESLQIHNTNFKDNHSKDIILNDGGGANLSIFYGEFKENNIEKSILSNDGKFCSIEKTIFQNNILDNKMNIINNSELTLINLKIKDKEKSILNRKYILIRNSPPELKNTICGEGTVEIDEKIIRQRENFDFRYLDKKIHESKNKEIILDHDITFESYERDFYEGGIELDIDDLIINGNGHTIDGTDKSRIFIITGKNITLKNIIFKNGHSHKNHDNILNNNGGAIKINHNNKISIKNCEFINNTSEEYGGAIYNFIGSLTIHESIFQENNANEEGSDIFNNGRIFSKENISNIIQTYNNGIGKFYHLKHLKNHQKDFTYLNELINTETNEIKLEHDIILNITNNEQKTFKNGIKLEGDNIIIDGNGHTIDAQGLTRIFYCTGKDVIIKNIILKNGFAEGDGGAITNGYGELTITESTLTGNTAQKHGGAISNSKGRLTITESTLNKNTAQNEGGAITNKGELTITKSTLTENTAYGYGGAISNSKGGLTITESTLTGNTAQKHGGAISNSKGGLTITESTLNENTAKGIFHSGGAIYNKDGEITITKSALTGNTASRGGAIYNKDGELIITSSKLNKNSSNGTFEVGGGAILNNGGELTITSSTLNENTTRKDGGAINNIGEGELTIIKSALNNNIASEKYGSGGAIYNSSSLTITESVLTGNTAQGTESLSNGGGAINNIGGELTIHESILNNNTAKMDGGAISLKKSKKYESNNCTFKDNNPDDVYEEK